MLQEKLKEAQRKEQELNHALRQYRNDLEAAEVYCTIMVHVLMCVTGKFIVFILTVFRVQGMSLRDPRRPWKRRRLPWKSE